MRQVVYTDRRGYLRRTFIRDDDGDEMAEFGLPAGIPDVDMIDWDVIKLQVNNVLVEQGVTTRNELHKTHSLEQIAAVVKRHVDAMFVEEDRRKKAA